MTSSVEAGEQRMDWKLFIAIIAPVASVVAFLGGLKVLFAVIVKRLDLLDERVVVASRGTHAAQL